MHLLTSKQAQVPGHRMDVLQAVGTELTVDPEHGKCRLRVADATADSSAASAHHESPEQVGQTPREQDITVLLQAEA